MTQIPVGARSRLRLKNNIDHYCVSLIREMESYGWVGSFTAKGHVLMRAPDGVTTCMVSPKVGAEHRRHNLAREFRTWLREQQAAAAAAQEAEEAAAAAAEEVQQANRTVTVEVAVFDREPEPVAAAEPVDTAESFTCEVCDRPFAGAQPLAVHRVRSHVKVECSVCDRPMSPGNLPRHMRRHVEALGTHEEVMREVLQLRTALARTQTEAREWQSIAEDTEAELGELQDGLRKLIG